MCLPLFAKEEKGGSSLCLEIKSLSVTPTLTLPPQGDQWSQLPPISIVSDKRTALLALPPCAFAALPLVLPFPSFQSECNS
jgi:hypothetical protein